MIRIVATKAHRWVKERKIGDTYEVKGQSELAVIRAMKWGDVDESPVPEPEKPKRAYTKRTFDVTPVDVSTLSDEKPGTYPPTLTDEVKPKRTYTRRDLKAQE